MGIEKLQFEMSGAELVSENSDSQFADVEVFVCRSGENTHRMPISEEAIKNGVHSLARKPFLAAFYDNNTRLGGHDDIEQACGFFDDDVSLVRKSDGLYIRGVVHVWKRYFQHLLDIFRKNDNKIDVSMECEVLEGTEPTPTAEGSIDCFSIMGVTALGVNPAIVGSHATVLSFSEMLEEYEKENSLETHTEFSNKSEVNVETKEEESMAEKEKDVIEEVEMSESEVVEEEAVEEMADEPAVEETETEEMADTEEMEDEPTDDEQPDEPEQEEEMAEEDTTEEMEETVAESFVSKLSRVCDCAYTERCGCIDGMEFAEEEGIVMSKLYGIFERHCELEAFYEETLAEQTQFAVSEVLASVKAKLSAEDYKTVEEMSQNVKFEEIDIFRKVITNNFLYINICSINRIRFNKITFSETR